MGTPRGAAELERNRCHQEDKLNTVSENNSGCLFEVVLLRLLWRPTRYSYRLLHVSIVCSRKERFRIGDGSQSAPSNLLEPRSQEVCVQVVCGVSVHR